MEHTIPKEAIICTYTNGYIATYIDKLNPEDTKRLRDPKKDPFAFPEETIVIFKDGTIVCFIIDIRVLKEYEAEFHLVRR